MELKLFPALKMRCKI